ncbi:MAG: cobyric acid synthase [Lachnospiraceae bacterium]|nr:cobyric acid synthase [Lachnospiraceae bacterium]
MSKVIMIQGTMSGAGKSMLVAGLCRIFRQDGYRVAPFKSQNMALNSYITSEGLEMGRAQVMQAEAAGIVPSVHMNPILLKPTNDVGSQVIVNGEVVGNMSAREYFAYKKQLVPEIKKAFQELEKQADIIVIEGAGSPAEINLKENDIVNMGMAELADAPVLLVGDIDRGGVFAQLLGTVILLAEKERARVKGLVINKFRGDKTLLEPGIDMLEEQIERALKNVNIPVNIDIAEDTNIVDSMQMPAQIPVIGVVPYMSVRLEDEDSLSGRFDRQQVKALDLAVIRYPRISNFTDFDVFEQAEGVSLRYVQNVADLGEPDMIFLPGSKNTIGDLKWMRENGLEAAVKKLSQRVPVFGICGGFQMLGEWISDPDGVEGQSVGEKKNDSVSSGIRGMELLPVTTILREEKIRRVVQTEFAGLGGMLEKLNGLEIEGYEIHMGETVVADRETVGTDGSLADRVKRSAGTIADQAVMQNGDIYGTYIHGVFDGKGVAPTILNVLAKKKGVAMGTIETGQMLDYRAYKETQYDLLAETLREHLDMQAIYGMLREAGI